MATKRMLFRTVHCHAVAAPVMSGGRAAARQEAQKWS